MIRWLFIRDNIGRLGGVRMKKVIISADDFGRRLVVNLGRPTVYTRRETFAHVVFPLLFF